MAVDACTDQGADVAGVPPEQIQGEPLIADWHPI